MNLETFQKTRPYIPPYPFGEPDAHKKVLIRMRMGLGDAVQLTVVLQHLRKYRPNWVIDYDGGPGVASVGRGHCRHCFEEGKNEPTESYDYTVQLGMWDHDKPYHDSPSTNAAKFLRETFWIEPDSELLKYQFDIRDEVRERMGALWDSLGCQRLPNGRYNAIVVHSRGSSWPEKKNITHADRDGVLKQAEALGFQTFLLESETRTLPAGRVLLFGRDVPADAEYITAFLAQCSLFVGVDSGPLHCAGATDTPTLGLFTKHSPLNCMEPCANVTFMVPSDHQSISPANHESAHEYFKRHYGHIVYRQGEIVSATCEAMRQMLITSPPESGVYRNGFWCHRDKCDSGRVAIDIVYLNDVYRSGVVYPSQQPRFIVDVGAHIGTFARLWHERHPHDKIVCVEACPENIPILYANVGHFADVIQAACTYQTGPLVLMNNTLSAKTGDTQCNRVVADAPFHDEPCMPVLTEISQVDRRPLPRITLEEIRAHYQESVIHVLKLDCEGCEYDIFANADLDCLRWVIGEFHGTQERWQEFLSTQVELLEKFEYHQFKSDGFHFINKRILA